MSTEAAPSSLILVRLSADGTVKWIPLESPEQHVTVAADDAYTLIDRANYEAPQTLVVERVGKDLVVEVHGHAAPCSMASLRPRMCSSTRPPSSPPAQAPFRGHR
jgi:hypothetical protein